MKYACLVFNDEKQMSSLSEADRQSLMDEYRCFTEAIRKSGHWVTGGQSLQPGASAMTVRVRNGGVSTTDGPFIETKEQLGGFYLINARDLNEAIQVAARIPCARTGTIEVRPVNELDFMA